MKKKKEEKIDVEQICENCKGKGLVQIAPNVRGVRQCEVCNGTGRVSLNSNK